MATIDSREIIVALIDNNGYYEGDPQVYAVHEYTNMAGKITWHIAYNREGVLALAMSPHVRCPRLLWSQETGKVADPGYNR